MNENENFFLNKEFMAHTLFFAHARELLKNPELNGSWTVLEFEPNKFRIMKTVRDKHRRKINIIIQPNTGYPERPPLVKTMPPHRDPCFHQENGELDWTVIKSNGRYTWELYASYKNPLIYLFDELKTKYKLLF